MFNRPHTSVEDRFLLSDSTTRTNCATLSSKSHYQDGSIDYQTKPRRNTTMASSPRRKPLWMSLDTNMSE